MAPILRNFIKMLRKDNILKSFLFSFCLPSAILSITITLQIAVTFPSNKRHCFFPSVLLYLCRRQKSISSYPETLRALISRKVRKRKYLSNGDFFFVLCFIFLAGQQKKKEVPFTEMLFLIVRRA